MRQRNISALLVLAGFCCNNVSAELTKQDLSELDQSKINEILIVSRLVLPKCLFDTFFRCVDIWQQQLFYVKEEISKGRWDGDDRVVIYGLVYNFPICNLIKHFAIRFCNFVAVSPELNWDVILPLLEEILSQEILSQNKSQEIAMHSCGQISLNLKYQQLDALCKLGEFGEAVCYSWKWDIEEWIQSGKPESANLPFWKYFREKWDVGLVYLLRQKKKEMQEDLYYIIRFFLVQIGCSPELLGLGYLPNTWNELEQQATKFYMTLSSTDWLSKLGLSSNLNLVAEAE